MTPRQVRIHLTRIQDSLNALRGELEYRLGFGSAKRLVGPVDGRVAALRAAAARAAHATSKR